MSSESNPSTPKDSASARKARVPGPTPERFVVSRATLRWDLVMNRAIVVGGIGIILAVFGIFAFIAAVIWPLFQKASIEAHGTLELTSNETGENAIFGLDEWSELPFHYDGDRNVVFTPVDGSEGSVSEIEFPEDTKITFSRMHRSGERILFGTEKGQVGTIEVSLQPSYEDDQRTIRGSAELGSIEALLDAPDASARVLAADHANSGSRQILTALIDTESGDRRLLAISLKQKQGLLGGGKIEVDAKDDLTDLLEGETPIDVLAPTSADSVVVLTESDTFYYLFRVGSDWELRQKQHPFPEDPDRHISTVGFLFGDVSLVFCDDQGNTCIYSLYIPEGSTKRLFGLTKQLEPLTSAATWFAPSRRNKSFMVGNEAQAALCYSTTADIRAQIDFPFSAVGAAFDGKAEHVGILDREGLLHFYDVHDPHPEAGVEAFFGKVWYEGYNEPRWEWQSTGGTDDFEPKLSLMPLIVGSFKGTLYALLFAVPIAILAAIYTAQFLGPKLKNVIKPSMEIMASLPSVVLGFIAALWLAPVIETKVPSVLLSTLAIPIAALLAALIWVRVPLHLRNRLPSGAEFWLVMPLMAVLAWAGWALGPALESAFFVVDQPDGSQIADFRLWWPEFSGLPYDMRNCLVVGFIMGFAVIPVIFTIAEDALSNVPPALCSASEALGASRWQVVRTVVLPIASAGIFSAVMIGLGRAVGETMIVVMATGNTPIMDEAGRLIFGEAGIGGGKFPLADQWNPFNGMRTLSANIAVELPEAPQGSTHYRALFLGAMVLFILTFILNTAAEILRQRLREKFKVI